MQITPNCATYTPVFQSVRRSRSARRNISTQKYQMLDIAAAQRVLQQMQKEFGVSEPLSEEFCRGFSELMSCYALELVESIEKTRSTGLGIEALRKRYPEFEIKPGDMQ